MKGALFIGLVALLSSGVARADDQGASASGSDSKSSPQESGRHHPAGARHVQEGFRPRVKGWQIFVNAPPIATQNYAGGFYEPHGLGINLGSSGGTGFTQIGFGVNGGAGYIYSDLVELGGAVGLDIGNTSAGGGSISAYQFLLEPLVKLNLGSRLRWGKHLNPFALAGVPIGFGGTSASSGFVFGVELAGGVEYMFGDHVGVHGYIPLDFVLQTGSPSVFVFSFGIQYGITVYF